MSQKQGILQSLAISSVFPDREELNEICDFIILYSDRPIDAHCLPVPQDLVGKFTLLLLLGVA